MQYPKNMNRFLKKQAYGYFKRLNGYNRNIG